MKGNKVGIKITKASGAVQDFSSGKFLSSLYRAGASKELAESILNDVQLKMYEGMPTQKIYRLGFGLLKRRAKNLAGKYSLKRGIMELGPSGFPFEKYFSEILARQGFGTSTGQIVAGQCVNHEIDVIAEKDNQHFMIECKYHNRPGTVCDVKIPLYIQARFKDVEAAWKKLPGHGARFHQGWVVTNTKFTGDALRYGLCVGLKLVSWDYPKSGSLRDMIDALGLYPVTCITTLTRREKQELLDRKVVLCHELCAHPELLNHIGIHEPRRTTVVTEACALSKAILIDSPPKPRHQGA